MAQVYPEDGSEETGGVDPRGSLHSLHYNDVAMEAEEVGAGRYDTTSKEVTWIRNNIKMRVCRNFIEKQTKGKSNLSENPECYCGYKTSEHIESKSSQFPPAEIEWKVQTHTKSTLTNAFGEVEFIGYGENERKFVRVDVETPMEDMLHLLMHIWGLEKPNLLISVTGGAKNFNMKQRLKEVFRRGLMKVAKSTGIHIYKWYHGYQYKLRPQ
ncbi:hypothetical protein KUTeg_002792 [Tegillarca granosa]|uniref:TRPM SLOG domain-containing protein n=1 Tax=Tegillarca granosa TaxID=220873 RepID=A0ABQ9FQT4_TEGGR|nr:hypothetical protein KUTeg_002792 [Tegillarca granosa]